MTKLKLIGSLVDTIKEQGRYSGFYVAGPKEQQPIGYDYEDKKVLTVSDVEDWGELSDEEIEVYKELETFPSKGKCRSWSHLSKDGKSNGELEGSDLQTLKHHSGHKLSTEAAKDFDKMEDKYLQEKGHTFKSFTDSYRPYSVQWDKFDWNKCIKTGKPIKKETENITISYPGTSNHGWGEAVDIGDSDAQTWIKANGKQYGWCWGENKSESWHFTYDLSYCS
jgi:hypothetical protein